MESSAVEDCAEAVCTDLEGQQGYGLFNVLHIRPPICEVECAAPAPARRKQQGSFPRKSQPGDVPAPQIKLDDMSFKRSEKAIILFDLNGTLTSHTVQRYSAGVNKMRPGLHHLRRLQVELQSIYSTALE